VLYGSWRGVLDLLVSRHVSRKLCCSEVSFLNDISEALPGDCKITRMLTLPLNNECRPPYQNDTRRGNSPT
jgi:hypothetical protein